MSVSYRPPDVGRVHPKVGDFVGDTLSLSRQVSTKCDIAHLCRSHHLEESVAENIYNQAVYKSQNICKLTDLSLTLECWQEYWEEAQE